VIKEDISGLKKPLRRSGLILVRSDPQDRCRFRPP
jgi:hypothetical protein